MNAYDIVVVGAGPSGLTAAIYAARYNLKTVVFDMGYGRSTWFQLYSNYLGFPDGITALKLRELGTAQAKKLGVKIHEEEPVKKIAGEDGSFTVKTEKSNVEAKKIILATGIEDVFPVFDGFESFVGRSMYWCILCDGHYVNSQRVLCVTDRNDGVDMTLRLRAFTSKLTFMAKDLSKINPAELAKLKQEKIPIIEGKITAAEAKEKGKFKAVTIKKSDGSQKRLEVDAVFHRLGTDPYNQVAKHIGLDLDERGLIKVDPVTQETSKTGIYASGDGATGHLHQIHAATYTGSRAAVHAYRALYDDKYKVK